MNIENIVINNNSILCFSKEKYSFCGSYIYSGVVYNTKQSTNNYNDLISNELLTSSEYKNIKNFDGFYSMVAWSKNKVVIVVDKIRSSPIFYININGKFYISDSAEHLRKTNNLTKVDKTSQLEFRLSGFVSGKDTLFSEIKQVPAGMLVEITNHGVSYHSYYSYEFRKNTSNSNLDYHIKKLHASNISVTKRLIDLAKGKQIVIPLSGGYDSRLIAATLVKLNYKNIIAFTYGKKNNSEALVSKKIANILKIPWHFIEYKKGDWKKAFQSKDMAYYYLNGVNWCGLPIHQDWLAVKKLKKTGVVDFDAIFVPGHSGDMVAGSHTRKIISTVNMLSIDELIYSYFYVDSACLYWDLNEKKKIISKVRKLLYAKNKTSTEDKINIFESWNWQERQAKTIVNSVRVYEHFGFSWWLPQWDREFVEFWLSTPIEIRLDDTFYKNYVNSIMPSEFENNDIYKYEMNSHSISRSYLMGKLKKTAVKHIVRAIKGVFFFGGFLRWSSPIFTFRSCVYRMKNLSIDVFHSEYLLGLLKGSSKIEKKN